MQPETRGRNAHRNRAQPFTMTPRPNPRPTGSPSAGQLPPRRDPPSRPVDASSAWASFGNTKADKHYVGVYLNDPTARDKYAGMGYEPEVYGPDGLVPRGGRGANDKDGMEVVRRGHLWMSISMERKRELDEYGEDGESGMSLARKLEEQIIKRDPAQLDPSRGMHGITYTNDTTPHAEEIGV